MGYNELVLRSLGAIVFIAIVGATGIYFANRPTVARGEVLAADIIAANPNAKRLDCDKEVPIGHKGGTFKCAVELHNGERGLLELSIDRNGTINKIRELGPKLTTDPWGD